MLAAFAATSCDKNDSNESKFAILTFEDSDYKGTESSYWSSLIDSPEYYGALLYSSTTQYAWADGYNTYLSGVVNEGADYYTNETEWMFWTGGIAVSNYYCEVVSGTEISYDKQLSVSNGSAGAAGNGGSKNFAVVNDGAAGGYGSVAALTFADDTARTIDHLYISATSYLESVALDGNDNSSALGADDTFTVTATGYDCDGSVVESTTYNFVSNGALISGWNKWSLATLGAVVKVEFSIASSVQSWGSVSLPAYFAIDDIAVAL